MLWVSVHLHRCGKLYPEETVALFLEKEYARHYRLSEHCSVYPTTLAKAKIAKVLQKSHMCQIWTSKIVFENVESDIISTFQSIRETIDSLKFDILTLYF